MLPAEGESRVESRRRGAADDVRADAQPVGIEPFITGPALQVAKERPGSPSDRLRRRQPEEIAVGIRHLDLRHEEVMIGGEEQTVGEAHIELHFLARDPAVAAGVNSQEQDGCRPAALSWLR